MNRSLVLGLVLFFAVVGISLLSDQPQAQAGWGHHWGGWHGYYGGYGGCWAPVGCVGWSGCYGYAAPCAGWYGCGGWGYGGYGGWGCAGYGRWGYAGCGGWGYAGCCGYTAAYADCCGSGVTYGYGGGAIQKGSEGGAPAKGETPTPAAKEQGGAAPDQQVAPPPPPAPKAEPPKPAAAAAGSSAFLNVRVPGNATVMINDYRTTTSGESRRYVSRGLQPGLAYQFAVRAEVTRDGATAVQTKVVRLQAGQSTDLVFDFDAPQVASSAR